MFDEPTRAALLVANVLSGDAPHALDVEHINQLRGHFSEVQLAEMILVCGQANLNNRAGNAAKQLLGSTDG